MNKTQELIDVLQEVREMRIKAHWQTKAKRQDLEAKIESLKHQCNTLRQREDALQILVDKRKAGTFTWSDLDIQEKVERLLGFCVISKAIQATNPSFISPQGTELELSD